LEKRLLKTFCLIVLGLVLGVHLSQAQVISPSPSKDSLKLVYPLKDMPFLSMYSRKPTVQLALPSNIKREVIYDPITRHYSIRETLGSRLYRPPQYYTLDEYQHLEGENSKKAYWRKLSDDYQSVARSERLIPTIYIDNEGFERIFGSNRIDIYPRGSADITLMAQRHRNDNPMFNERQRRQWGVDFDQRMQMNLVGQIGDRLKITTNYNTQAQFDFENQIRLDYTGKDDDILQRVELGNVNLPLSTTFISGTESLFGLKTQWQFGKVHFTSIFSQQRSQQKEITIRNGAQESEFELQADNYEDNQHYFLSQYFRNTFNRAMAMAPVLTTQINITQIEVWISNRSNAVDDSRDVLALLDLGEQQPYNSTLIQPGSSVMPSTGIPGQVGQPLSNNLLQQLGDQGRLSHGTFVQQFFQGTGNQDNYAKLTYARKLKEGTDYTVDRRLGFISLRMPLQGDQVLSVAYRYTAAGNEYQVGEFSTDIPVSPSDPKMLYTKLLRGEVLKTQLPTWDLMMKNIYSLGAYNVGANNFRLQILRLEDESGVERPALYEGQRTQNKLWIQLMGLDRLNPQNAMQPDGTFDFLPGLTIQTEQGKLMFPVIEPFGKDLADQFIAGAEELLIQKYSFQALYDSTKVIAQQLFPNQNRYVIKGTYESEVGTEYQLGVINVPRGSVQVYAGTAPLQEGVDFMVDYEIGRVRILNQSLLQSGQPLRIKIENSQLFGMQQRTMVGGRLDYLATDKLRIGATLLNLTERPMTQKVNLGEEPISNTMWGADMSYQSASRWLTRLVDRLPLLSTNEPSSISFYGEFAQMNPGHPRALNFAGTRSGISYLDDFENSRSFIDLKSAYSWQISSTPATFPESQLINDLQSGFNRARLAFYNIDPIFYRNNRLTPTGVSDAELSNHRVREVLEQEVFPYRQSTTGMPLFLATLDLAFYPNLRGPYNYTTTGVLADGRLTNPRNRWGGIFRKIDVPDFESQNIEFVEIWMMDPFLTNPGSEGGEFYLELGHISEDILKDGRKSIENGLSPSGDLSQLDETVWGRVARNQPIIQAFDNNAQARARQDVGLDGLSDQDESVFHLSFLNQMRNLLQGTALATLESDPSSDNYVYFRGSQFDTQQAGILKRYEQFNGLEGNAPSPDQSQLINGIETSASTLLPDGEDINRDNNMNELDAYYQYKMNLRPTEMEVGRQYISDMHTAEVRLPNGKTEQVKWYQFRVPVNQFTGRFGDIQDFKSIRFIRMFMTDFSDTTVLRMAQLQLVRGEWRRYNSENNVNKVILDPEMPRESLDQSQFEVAAVNIEQNGNRLPFSYRVPPGIERQLDWSNMNSEVQLNEQSLTLEVKNLKDGHGRAAFRTTNHDFRAYGRIQMFIHAEGPANLRDDQLRSFLRVGTDDKDHYYQFDMPLKVSRANVTAEDIWPKANQMNIEIRLFQEAKEARNRTYRNGQPWPIEIPFVYAHGEHRITIVGQPDISKVKFYMLGVLNPFKEGSGANTEDDGLEKSAIIWFNELRLTDFDDKGGWAATARMQAKLADFAVVSLSGSKSTVGFGSMEQRIGQRSRHDETYLDMITNAELGKFFPDRFGMRIPLFFSYTNQRRTPEYNPLMPDIKMNNALANLSRYQKDSLLRVTQEFSTRKSFNLTNVRKIRTNIDQPLRPWQIENWSASYAYSAFYRRDHLTETDLQKNYRASLDYTFANSSLTFKEPFKNKFQSSHLRFLSEFNYNLMPSLLHFRMDVNRIYNENTLRDNAPDNYLPSMGSLYNKNFVMNRIYGISWNLTQQLKLDFNATNYAIIDEPMGQLTGLQRDTLWENFWKLGRNTDYNHQINLTYQLPLQRFGALDWIEVNTRYGAQFTWQTEPLFSIQRPDIALGNSIQNARTIQVNPRFNMEGLYGKFAFLRQTQDESSLQGVLVGLLTSIKDLNAAYTRVESTFLPGYTPRTQLMGYDFDHQAPGWGFIWGSQQDLRPKAIRKGWMTTDSLQTQLYLRSYTEDFSLRALTVPFADLQIEWTALRLSNQSYSSSFEYSQGAVETTTPMTTGNYSISYWSMASAFKDPLTLFRQFEANRIVISQRLGASNPYSDGLVDGYGDGYGKNAQEVVVNAFIAAYTGRSSEKMRLSTYPKIPLPSWQLSYNGLSKLTFLEDWVSLVTLNHGYRNQYSISGYNAVMRYAQSEGHPTERDINDNFLPPLQYQQVSLFEQFAPLLGVELRLRNSFNTNVEYRSTRTVNLSLQNSQLSVLREQALVVGLGYRATGLQMPFGLFSSRRMNNDLNFKIDFAFNDLKTLVYRADLLEAEISAGNRSISLRPSMDYVINQRFTIRLFYDSESIRPYTSQTFATSYTNFGFNLRMMLQ
jgi:cell surface protein SprA